MWLATLVRNLARTVGVLMIVGVFIMVWLIFMEAPLPQQIVYFEAATGITQRGRFIRDGFAVITEKSAEGLGYSRYVAPIDDYQFGYGGHYDFLPYHSIIKIGKYIDRHLYACVNGMSVLFDTPDLMIPATAEDISRMPAIGENHANDTCRLVIGRADRTP